MNTPNHAIVNLAILGQKQQPSAILPIVIGAILPDIPIFIFYFWAKFIERLPARQIWSEAYYQPFWQNIVATFHSIPLALMGVAIAHYCGWPLAKLVCISSLLHCLGDLPVHADDAHRHFFPFSNYRFISPVSYWDPRKNGAIGALAEVILALISTIPVWGMLQSPLAKALLIAIDVFYTVAYLYFYLRVIVWRSL